MYKRKFPKTKTVAENDSSQLTKSSTDSLSVSTPSMSTIFNKDIPDDNESSGSPSMLEDFISYPVEKKQKTADINGDNTTDDDSEPLFDDNDDTYFHLKQTLLSCGLHLKCDQNILCWYIY